MCSGDSCRSLAARLSTSCSGVLAPMMMLVTKGFVSIQARATRATDTPVASATARKTRSTPFARSRSTGGKSKLVRRAPADRIVHLRADEAGEPVRVGAGEGLHRRPRRQVAEAHVARFARSDDVVE